MGDGGNQCKWLLIIGVLSKANNLWPVAEGDERKIESTWKWKAKLFLINSNRLTIK